MAHLRSGLFTILLYLGMAVIGLVFAPFALFSRRAAFRACKTFCQWAFILLRVLVGIRCELRGPVPQGETVIAAKHQSFLDIIIIFSHLPRPKFIMKKELLWTPFIGLYARRIGCVPVDRGKRGAAIARMVRDVAAETAEPGQLIIYSQGTRVAPGVKAPYKVGTAVLYTELGYPCVPAATNVGLFWPRKGPKRPGRAVVEFLDPIPPGLARDDFMLRLENAVETRSDALMAEAGFQGPERAADRATTPS